MKALTSAMLIVCSLPANQARAACEIPTPVVSIPDGSTATEQQLLEVQNEVKAYVAAMDRYIACQNEELTVQSGNASPEFLFQMSSRVEFARQEVDAIATRFNEQVNAFRAARPAAPFPPR
jgi:hypothetical protein